MHHQPVKDPVCGMDVKPKDIQARFQYEDKTYYFCSTVCREQFQTDPKRYAKKEAAA